MRRIAFKCNGCRTEGPARFRTVASEYLCDQCWQFWGTHGRLPTREELEVLLNEEGGYGE